MAKIKILTLLIGVALRVAQSAADQSGLVFPNEQPIGSFENDVGKRRSDTPEVVLQLKYDRGELNRIYLAQFRKVSKPWTPSVPARTNLCADLCHAGLGGEACGASCPQMIPVGLKSALQETNKTDVVYGMPRFSVCPSLCSNYLGEPLCNCVESDEVDHAVDWSGVCSVFCVDGYALGGCPTCESLPTSDPTAFAHYTRVLNTSEGWSAWCNVQCRQGQGGAACNCDRAPFQ